MVWLRRPLQLRSVYALFCVSVRLQLPRGSHQKVFGMSKVTWLYIGKSISEPLKDSNSADLSKKTAYPCVFIQVTALVKLKECEDTHLGEEVDRNWAEVVTQQYVFERLNREVRRAQTHIMHAHFFILFFLTPICFSLLCEVILWLIQMPQPLQFVPAAICSPLVR